ncbi:DNA helicase/exodeoxyribonuclease V beta subunit [Methylobacter tundripaludum]|uniref:RecBCD enzyme subunit RecB n=1 Tax=Methylobacter tundripaludum TaxID=173365 RepID=A0A2S6GEJ9_9GAMM|nr:exodeoxyribonuclease V subunit beta [Methylobacter tundripaludum]PPK63655.1 DNA helicase/exodeoxyribonuclease V beta subunit [Methylobacter tundripaludum]
MKINDFNPVKTGLLKGVNLIEASAGTGKTYAIAMLVLRFVVEQGIAIEKLLVVTFTKAATEELKDRVRSRLAEARRALEGSVRQAHSTGSGQAQDGQTQNIDRNITEWLDSLDIAPELIKQRLTTALLDIDQAGIFTIHGFCQRVLREHALESGQLFDAELTGDLAEIKQACADDFWRKQVYQRSAWEIAVLTADFNTPDALLASVAAFPGNGLATHAQLSVYPDCESLDAALKELQRQADLAKDQLDKCATVLRNSFADDKFKVGYTDTFDYYYDSLSAWLHGATTQIPDAEAFALLTGNGLTDALNGNKFRTNKTQSGDQRKAEYLAELAADTSAFDALAAAFRQISLVFRKTLLDSLREELGKRLHQLNVLSFDDLISRLAEALQSDKGELLTAELQQRFEVALIDEFQDTDDSQWHIFSSSFAAPSQYLYLIGDPKQAIYKFRGADIYSYLDAQKHAEHQFTLGHNWRSHPQLVKAVNALFQRDRAFFLDGLEFINVEPGLSADNGELHYEGRAAMPMVLWQLPESDSKTGYWTAGKAADEIRIAVVNEIVDLLTGGYRLQPMNRPLLPKDIAILVRTNTQARDYQAALRLAGVPSVLNSTESVFASQEAADLYRLLQAVAYPGDSGLLKQALTLDWFGLDGQTLYQLINNEIELDVWVSRFLGYFHDWQQTGLMAMMQHLLAQEKIRANASKTLMAERQLTNLHHLIELVQQAAVDEHLGINKTLDWLRSAIAKAGSAEDQQLRLESDDDAVKIVTMHRSKGLEYSIVFCPYLWQRSDRLHSERLLIRCHENGQTVVDLGSEDFERRRELALKEELAEDLRVFYVAVTRAKYRCYIAWADVRSQDKPNDSAMAWLLEFAEADFSAQQAKLKAFQDQADYRLLEAPGDIAGSYHKTVADSRLQAKKRKRSLYTNWQMSSYTALSALSLSDAPELPEDKAREQSPTVRTEPGAETPELPRGAHVGNIVHDLLENNAFIDLAERKDISAQRDKACQRYGLKLERPQMLDELLQAAVTTPLSEANPDFCLMNLAENQCLKEMPFYLSMQTMDAAQINRILRDTPAFQPLTAKQMCGYLTGFIDLVCALPGSTPQYYVMDYKTNGLPDYSSGSLTDAMREHNYGLQYWIYTVVLHRYLQTRLPGYDYETHFGGVRYLFVRGMQPDQPMSGVYQDRPDFERVEALAALFGGEL